MTPVLCPRCGTQNGDNWPLQMPDGSVAWGGCQDCMEAETDRSWWAMVALLGVLVREMPS